MKLQKKLTKLSMGMISVKKQTKLGQQFCCVFTKTETGEVSRKLGLKVVRYAGPAKFPVRMHKWVRSILPTCIAAFYFCPLQSTGGREGSNNWIGRIQSLNFRSRALQPYSSTPCSKYMREADNFLNFAFNVFCVCSHDKSYISISIVNA